MNKSSGLILACIVSMLFNASPAYSAPTKPINPIINLSLTIKSDFQFPQLFATDFYPKELILRVDELAHFSLGTTKENVIKEWELPDTTKYVARKELLDYTTKGVELTFQNDHLQQIGITLVEPFPLNQLSLNWDCFKLESPAPPTKDQSISTLEFKSNDYVYRFYVLENTIYHVTIEYVKGKSPLSFIKD